MTKAEEFAQYMATSAEAYMEAVNNFLMVIEEGDAEEAEQSEVDAFRESHSDAWKRLQSDIYEFRKRLPK